jgi:DNA-directed RNA polymerase specialized sigma24 family protein
VGRDRVLGLVPDADILSETFIRLWHARDRVDLTTVKGYLLAIVWIWHAKIRRRLRVSGL